MKRERDGQMGPMNRLLNMAGAMLRNYAMTRFPFPVPKIVGRRGKKYVAVYEDELSYGQVEVNHTTLPELDFIDMIRARVFELARKCFINNVPTREARKYVNLLIRRLSPFLEYLYTSGKSGRWGFKRKRKQGTESSAKDADRILREIVREIEALYGGILGRSLAPTHALSQDFGGLAFQFFLDQVAVLKYPKEDVTDSEYESRIIHAEFLTDLCKGDLLRDADAQYLAEEVKRRSRWYGIKWHKMLSNGLPQPFSLRSIVLDGDKLARPEMEWLIVAEVPVQTDLGAGIADIVAFTRRVFTTSSGVGQVTRWRPGAVFDIKTKTAFNWSIEGEEKVSKKHGDITVPKFSIRRRPLTEREWEATIQNAPDDYGREQLQLYAKALSREYAQLTGDDTESLPITGTLIVDTGQEPQLVQRRLSPFIISLCKQLCNLPKDRLARKLVTRSEEDESSWLRLTAIVDGVSVSQQGILSSQESKVPTSQEDETSSSKSNIHLYLTATSASRSGPSAAWIAQYWHGLKYIQQVAKEKDIKWIDLSGDFTSRKLTRTRFRLVAQSEDTKSMFASIEWVNLSKVIESLFTAEFILSEIESTISPTEQEIVVVSGWSDLVESTPRHFLPVLNNVQREIVQLLSEKKCTVIWFSNPRPDEKTCATYQSRTLISPQDGIPLEGRVTKTVWNLPVRPYAFGQVTPLLDDLRVIVIEQDGVNRSELVEVPPLVNWTTRFWTQRKQQDQYQGVRKGRVPFISHDVLESKVLKTDLLQSALKLIPNDESDISSIPIYIRLEVPQSIGDYVHMPLRLTYQPSASGSRGSRGYVQQITPVPTITHSRRYRTQSVRGQETVKSTRTPLISSLQMVGIDPDEVYKTEMRRIRQTLDFLSAQVSDNQFENSRAWLEFFLALEDVVQNVSDTGTGVTQITRFLEIHPVSSTFWDSLLWTRERTLFYGMNSRTKKLLGQVLGQETQLIRHTGIALFLLLLGLSKTYSLTDKKIRDLWETVRPWYLLQLGLKSDKVVQFNMSSLWHRLTRKTSLIEQVSSSEISTILKGEVFVIEAPENLHDYWLFIEDPINPERLLAGVWRGKNPLSRGKSMSWGLIRHDEIAYSATKCDDPYERHKIAVTKAGAEQYLWIQEDHGWGLIGRMELVRRHSSFTEIRGIKITISDDVSLIAPEITQDEWDTIPPKLAHKLKSISDSGDKRIPVQIKLTVDINDFVISLLDDISVIEEIRIRKTADLLQFLRGPLVGKLHASNLEIYREFYTWNPYSDIDYGELAVFRPFIESRNPYSHFKFSLPSDASVFSSLETRSVSLKITHDSSLCPIESGDSMEHGLCWRIESDTDNLRMTLSDNEILRIRTAGELVLGGIRYLIDMNFEPNPATREGVVFRESRSLAWLVGARRLVPGTYLEMDDEQLHCSLVRQDDELQITVRSTKTGDIVYSWLLVKLTDDIDIDRVIEQTELTLCDISESYFGIQTEPPRIINYQETLNEVKSKVAVS